VLLLASASHPLACRRIALSFSALQWGLEQTSNQWTALLLHPPARITIIELQLVLRCCDPAILVVLAQCFRRSFQPANVRMALLYTVHRSGDCCHCASEERLLIASSSMTMQSSQ
jgi:hypothetical protein